MYLKHDSGHVKNSPACQETEALLIYNFFLDQSYRYGPMHSASKCLTSDGVLLTSCFHPHAAITPHCMWLLCVPIQVNSLHLVGIYCLNRMFFYHPKCKCKQGLTHPKLGEKLVVVLNYFL